MPVEVFAILGKTGGCSACQLEGISRSVTAGLRHGVPVEVYIKQLAGIKCPSRAIDEGEVIESCSDAISKAMRFYVDTYLAPVKEAKGET